MGGRRYDRTTGRAGEAGGLEGGKPLPHGIRIPLEMGMVLGGRSRQTGFGAVGGAARRRFVRQAEIRGHGPAGGGDGRGRLLGHFKFGRGQGGMFMAFMAPVMGMEIEGELGADRPEKEGDRQMESEVAPPAQGLKAHCSQKIQRHGSFRSRKFTFSVYLEGGRPLRGGFGTQETIGIMDSRKVGFALALLASACVNESNPPVDAEPAFFPRGVDGLDPAAAPATLELEDGDTLRLEARPVRKVLAGREVRMLSYNGSSPGPFLRVPQGASIVVRLVNRTGMETDLYFHGVRTGGRADAGKPVADGDSLAWRVTFPDAGAFWYHSRMREDYTREMGLYGGVLVTASDTALWRKVDREVPILIDDILLDETGMVPYRLDKADHAVLGRYGNVFLANGDVAPVFEFRHKEVVRFFATNACAARSVNFGLNTLHSSGVYLGREMKIVGFDNGPIAQPYHPYSELFAPGERFAFEVFLKDTATLYLHHILDRPEKPKEYALLAVFRVSPDSVDTGHGADFNQQGENAKAAESIRPFESHFGKSPDQELLIGAREKRPLAEAGHALGKIAHDPGSKGIVWEDTLGGVNQAATSDRLEWFFRDLNTGKENGDIAWTFARGAAPKIRIYNLSASLFPTPQAVHFGGQRFLVVAEGGVRPDYYGWRDTYLVGRGEVVDLVLDASNPGTWAAGTTIAERAETGMGFTFTVE